MATTAGSSPSNHSPSFSTAENLHSPRSHLASRVQASPWSQVSLGESDLLASSSALPLSFSLERNVCSYDRFLADSSCVSPSSEERMDDLLVGLDRGNDNCNSLASKKPAWNKPSNGGAVKAGPVIDANSWPALSESARASSKSSSDSIKSSQDGPAMSPLQVSGNTSLASPSSSAEKQVSGSGNRHFTSNNALPARQKSFKRGGVNFAGNGSLANPAAAADAPATAPKEHTHKGGKWDSAQRSHISQSSNDHPQQRYRRNNAGTNPRGDNSYHANYGGRREHDWVNQDWHSNRNFNGRNIHLQPRAVPGGFLRPPPSVPPFIAPPPFRPFATPLGFELATPMVYVHHDSFTGIPFIAPIPRHAMMFPAVDPQLHNKVVSQIEYYFSNENLIKDTYLRQNMDEQGWVSIKLIAGFNKVKSLTDDIHFILEALRSSKSVEVQGDRLRRRNDWMRWIMPPASFSGGGGGAYVPNFGSSSSQDMLASSFENLVLDGRNTLNAARAHHGGVPAP